MKSKTKPKEKGKLKIGRPTQYTQKLADEICMAIATSGKGIKILCKKYPHWPSKKTIMYWRISREDFSDQYVRAKQNQVETLVDEILEISDKPSKNYAYTRIRIDTRKWLASKLCPKLYGDRLFPENLNHVIKHEDALKELEIDE